MSQFTLKCIGCNIFGLNRRRTLWKWLKKFPRPTHLLEHCPVRLVPAPHLILCESNFLKHLGSRPDFLTLRRRHWPLSWKWVAKWSTWISFWNSFVLKLNRTMLSGAYGFFAFKMRSCSTLSSASVNCNWSAGFNRRPAPMSSPPRTELSGRLGSFDLLLFESSLFMISPVRKYQS